MFTLDNPLIINKKGDKTMKCPKCGKRIAGRVNFCPYCGYKDENGAMGGNKGNKLKEKLKNLPPEKKKKLKLATIITSVSLVVLIVVIIVAVTLSSIFRVAKVQKIELGMTKAQVEKILGTPNDIDDAYVPVAGGDIDVYLYYESKVARILKQIDKNADSDVDDWDDLEKALEKEEKLYDKLEKMKYKSIVIGFDRTTERVVSVAFNTKTQFSKSNPYDSWGTKELKEFSLNKTTLYLNEDLYAGDFWYTSTYKDGSYRMECIQYLQGFSTEEEGRKTPTLDNGWMTKQLSLEVKKANVVAESANAGWGRATGTGYYANGQTVTLSATPFDNYTFEGWYKGDNLVSTANTYSFKYAASTEATTFTAKFNEIATITDGIFVKLNDRTLTDYTIPDGVTGIADWAFSSCDKLTTLNLPDSALNVKDSAFRNCDTLQFNQYDNALYLGNNTNPYLVLVKATNTNITGCNINQNCRAIGGGAFDQCDALTSISLPSNVQVIEEYAFSNSGLVSASISNKVTSIGDHAFYNCANLTSITIPDSVTSIGTFAFYSCTSLTTISGSASNTSIVAKQCNAVSFSVTITSGESIPGQAFYYCEGLTSVAISNGVTNIGYSAFLHCTRLTSITIPDSVQIIAYDAFFECNNLQYNEYDNAYYLGNETNPYVVLIRPKSGGITSCIINDECKIIHDEAFHFSSLVSIVIPNNVTSIGESAFGGCFNLTSISIPDSVTNIGQEAFFACYGLTSVNIGTGVTSIGESAFRLCSNITSITYNGTKTQWRSISKGSDWDDDTGNYTIHCTDGDIIK